jgi:hypothetical protein
VSSLSKLKNPVPTKVVQVSDDEGFAVRGLSPSDVLGLYQRHTGQLSDMFEQLAETYQKSGGQVAPSDVQAFAVNLIGDAPHIMAELVALGSGSDPAALDDWSTDVEIARKLTFTVQMDALSKIGALTFTSDMPPGKFVALIGGLIQKLTTSAAASQAA